MNFEIREIHRQHEWNFVRDLSLEHINSFGLDLRGRSKITQFCDWVSSTIKQRRLNAGAMVEARDNQKVPEHITEAGKACINTVLTQELVPFTYNLYCESGIDEFIEDLRNSLLVQDEDSSVEALKDVIADYRIFYYLDIHDPLSAKHFTDWFAENVAEISELDEMV